LIERCIKTQHFSLAFEHLSIKTHCTYDPHFIVTFHVIKMFPVIVINS